MPVACAVSPTFRGERVQHGRPDMGPVAIHQQDLGLSRFSQSSGKVGGYDQTADAAAHNDNAMQRVSLYGGSHRSHFINQFVSS